MFESCDGGAPATVTSAVPSILIQEAPEGVGSEVFGIVDEPPREPLSSCEPRSFAVVFTAPSVPGRIRATLFYAIETVTEDGTFEGIQNVEFFANTVAE